ncbi:MAG: oxygen-independent coproporphyrinogen III oxidase [Bacteroidota bacterium]
MIDRSLLEKYNQPLPRYTSYPPATSFHEGFTGDDYIRAIRNSNHENPRAISLYLHIPFCPRLCFYCGCTTHISRDEKMHDQYMNALHQEIKMIAELLDKDRPVTQIHWGGGTPNALPVEKIEETMELIRSQFQTSPETEIAMECNPAYLDKDYIDRLLKAGFNRISLGIQDFDTKVLKAVNREPSALPLKEIAEQLKEGGAAVNLDFIYGLPQQTPESFTDTIRQAIELKPQRIVTFSYAHVPWVKEHQKTLEEYHIPGPDEKMTMFENARETLINAGYTAIGMDHFALPEDQLTVAINNHSLHRNFQGYCTRETTGQVYAFGMSAISQLNRAYAQNTKNIPEYIESINEGKTAIVKGYIPDETDVIVREVINEIMCNNYLNWSATAGRLNKTPEELKNITGFDPEKLVPLADDNLVTYDNETIKVTETGRFLIRNIAALFDPKLKAGTKRFSKTI